MVIGSVIQRGSFAYVYDENGRLLNTQPCDQIAGYTATSFSVIRGNFVYVYNANGSLLSTNPR